MTVRRLNARKYQRKQTYNINSTIHTIHMVHTTEYTLSYEHKSIFKAVQIQSTTKKKKVKKLCLTSERNRRNRRTWGVGIHQSTTPMSDSHNQASFCLFETSPSSGPSSTDIRFLESEPELANALFRSSISFSNVSLFVRSSSHKRFTSSS